MCENDETAAFREPLAALLCQALSAGLTDTAHRTPHETGVAVKKIKASIPTRTPTVILIVSEGQD